MNRRDAQKFIEAYYTGDELLHMIRVAEKVSDEAKVVALLHDVVEDGYVTLFDLWNRGVFLGQIWALELLTRPKYLTYKEYIQRICDAQDWSGKVAREVKQADLEDNLNRTGMPELKSRYLKAQALLQQQ
jgi:hypothetical protein